ncbi:MAG: hypothetical protein EZS28_018057 [Streblomastix strix]|uniref:Calpain catalytic domain-containing protein n=1 Tax=Streblomastix strix TaxID=222440 RepID=A0A5J4VUU8_9EUKA|nr:MAG: hypothetical protein EZS28_018057 [Streblomastix strix]
MGCCCSKSAIQVADAGAIEVLHETYTIQFMPQRPVVKRKKEKILNPREMIQFPKVRVTVQEQLSSGEIQTRTLTDADLKILSQSSIYHDIEFFIWNKENELHSESEEMFKDDYILRLSKGQQKNQAVWIRLKDAFYRESQIQIMTRASWQTVHQRRVRNCEISSALVLLSRAQELSHSDLLHRLILNHQIISGPEVNGNIINPKALYSKEGKYQIKLYFNGCWRVITIDDYLPSLPGGFTNISQEKECNTPLEQIELEEFRENKHESNKDEPIHKHEPFLKIPCPPESLLYPNQIRPLLCAFNWNDRQKILAEEIAIQAGKQSKFVQTKQKYMVDEEVQTISDNDIISLLGKDSSVSSQKLAKIQQQMILEAQMQLEKKLKETESQINEDEEWEEETEDEQNQTQNKKFDMNIALENIDTELDREIRMQHIREKEESEFWSIGGNHAKQEKLKHGHLFQKKLLLKHQVEDLTIHA